MAQKMKISQFHSPHIGNNSLNLLIYSLPIKFLLVLGIAKKLMTIYLLSSTSKFSQSLNIVTSG